MKEALLTTLRDRNTTQHAFRGAADKLAEILAVEMAHELTLESITVETPLSAASGFKVKEPVVLISILRSGVALLPAFLRLYNDAKVGFLGIKRDEVTAKAFQYYENIPPLTKSETIFILEPMIASGGTALLTLKKLAHYKVDFSKIFFVGFIASSEGINAIKDEFPEVQVRVVAEDKQLNAHKYIVPGLGDFGDRYFG